MKTYLAYELSPDQVNYFKINSYIVFVIRCKCHNIVHMKTYLI